MGEDGGRQCERGIMGRTGWMAGGQLSVDKGTVTSMKVTRRTLLSTEARGGGRGGVAEGGGRGGVGNSTRARQDSSKIGRHFTCTYD